MQPQQQTSGKSSVNTNGVGKIADEAKRAASDVATSAAGRFNEVKEQVMGFAQEEAEHLGELANQAVKQGQEYVRQAESLIRRRPLVAVAIAAGLGVLAVSLLFRPARNLMR